MTRVIRKFTPEEDDIIRTNYNDYIDLRTIAAKVSRDVGTLRQRLSALGLKGRDRSVLRILKWCPEHLKSILKEQGSEAFIEAVNSNAQQAEQDAKQEATALSEEEQAIITAQIAEIDARPELVRKEKMMALRALGLTLEAIGKRFGITRERVRQLTDPDFHRTISTAPRIGSIENLLTINSKLEEKIAANKTRIRTKTLDALLSCWNSADEDLRKEFLQTINTSKAINEAIK